MNLTAVSTGTGPKGLTGDAVQFTDLRAATVDLKQFHSSRWPTSRLPLENRRADLAELFLALLSGARYTCGDGDVFPRCLSASGPRVSEPGIDVLAYRIADEEISAPPSSDEILIIGEAKHTIGQDSSLPIDALAGDMSKTDLERVRDFLVLAQARLEDEQSVRYPERINEFLEAGSAIALLALTDSKKISPEECLTKMIGRFDGRRARCGVPIDYVVAASVEDLETWIASTV